MTNLDLAKQQGNQCGPNLIDAQKAGEINTGVSQEELLEQGNRASELITVANKEAQTENLLKAKEQYSQSGPNLIDAAENGELSPLPAEPQFLKFKANTSGSTLLVVCHGENRLEVRPINFEYSTDDGQNWNELNFTLSEGSYISDVLTFDNEGDEVLFRGVNPDGLSRFNYSNFKWDFVTRFQSTENGSSFAVSGDLQTLKDGTGEDKIAIQAAKLFYNDGIFLITEAPKLTATTLTKMCYYNMFGMQTSLVHCAEIPSLHGSDFAAVTESEPLGAMAGMYMGCSGLVDCFDLPKIKNQDFPNQMFALNFVSIFEGCTFNITDNNGAPLKFLSGLHYPMTIFDPEDPETSISINPFDMGLAFENINGFTFAIVNAGIDPDESGAISVNVSNQYHIGEQTSAEMLPVYIPTGQSTEVALTAYPSQDYDFVKWQQSTDGENWSDIAGATNEQYTVTINDTSEYHFRAVFASAVPEPEYLTFTAEEPNSTILIKSDLETAPSLEYSTDGGETWQEWPHSTENGYHIFDTITLNETGDDVKLRGVNPNGFCDWPNYQTSHFEFSGQIAASGNIQTIVDGRNITLVAKTMPMFSDFYGSDTPDNALTSAPELPATTLVERCYNMMFAACRALISAPELPATELAPSCYDSMFQSCTALISAPELLATELESYCYSNMFQGCTYITAAPSTLPANTLKEGCYDSMFMNCTFNMSDDGSTFNFNCGATLPQTVDGSTYSTYYDLAAWMRNTNGFDNI